MLTVDFSIRTEVSIVFCNEVTGKTVVASALEMSVNTENEVFTSENFTELVLSLNVTVELSSCLLDKALIDLEFTDEGLSDTVRLVPVEPLFACAEAE